jgi:drug/metabolite transporter (DMT)-like permease
MWFLFALLTFASWGTADLFYKKGSDPQDKYSHLKTAVAVGFVMGAFSLGYMFINSVDFVFSDILKYFPVSFMYILSMILGYAGLRYLELSVCSPIQNSSGAVTCILLVLFFGTVLGTLDIIGIVLICLGMVLLAVLEKRESDAELKAAGIVPDKKYTTGAFAIIFPILYCIIDGLGTFADGIYLDEGENYFARATSFFGNLFKSETIKNATPIGEDAAVVAYGFTFFFVGLVILLYLTLIKKEKITFYNRNRDKLYAAGFETLGQVFYVYAMSGNAAVAAPLIASYCVLSVLLSRVFLREKLSAKKYIVIGIVFAGILLLGISEGLAE